MATRPTQVFLSYAHADRVHLDAFRTHFGPVERGQNLRVWFDNNLTGGQVWDDEIRRALNGSDIFVCLITANFLNSNYIRDTELPAIWQAVHGRGALIVPVVLEQSFWRDEFGQVQCLPKDTKGQLKPAADWSPKRNGFYSAAEQSADAIREWLSRIPPPPSDPGPGLSLQVTEAGFDLSPDTPGPSERVDPLQEQLLRGLRRRWEQLLEDAGRSCRNTHPILYRNLEEYGRLLSAELPELEVASLVAEGSALGGLVEALRAPPRGSMSEPMGPELAASFESLLREHARLITGFAEGREIIARDRLLERMIDQPEEAGVTLHGVLQPMIREKDLLTSRAAAVLQAIDNGLIEAGVRSTDALMDALRQGGRAISFITRAVSSKISPADAATLATFGAILAGDPNLETYRAAFRFLEGYAPQISAFASNQPELRRLIDWTMEQIGVRSRPSPVPGEVPLSKQLDFVESSANLLSKSPEDFTLARAENKFQLGESLPIGWRPLIDELHFLGKKELRSIKVASSLPNLKKLDCSRTSINSVQHLRGHPSIEFFDCSYTAVDDLSPLSDCKSLKNLYAAFLTDSLSDLSFAASLGLNELVLLGTKVRRGTVRQFANFQINPDGTVFTSRGEPSGWFTYYLAKRK
ncbi:TIR domain-containing protein [Agrobacterium sp. ES01]|uniref:toll/interleukin-1 receptor domain-containing protein n=1 Tax=Agrobacterium sp. ES01 TaxID=3420714 RepID=UPI003D0C75E3